MTRKLHLNRQSEWAAPPVTILNSAALASARLEELLEQTGSGYSIYWVWSGWARHGVLVIRKADGTKMKFRYSRSTMCWNESTDGELYSLRTGSFKHQAVCKAIAALSSE